MVSQLHEDTLKRQSARAFTLKCLEDYPSVIATCANRIVGFVYSQRFAPDILELCNIVVAAERQSQGIGKRMLRAFEHAAASRWSSIIVINSSWYKSRSDMARAGRFYETSGYSTIHLTRNHMTALLIKSLKDD